MTSLNSDIKPNELQINGRNYLDAEYLARRELLLAWRRLKIKSRPRKPSALATVLAGTYAWPFPDLSHSAAGLQALERASDRLWDDTVKLRDKLLTTYPTESQLMFSVLLDSRLRVGENKETTLAIIENFECAVRDLAHVDLVERIQGERVARAEDEYVTDFVRRVFSYLWHVEGEEPTIDFADDGGPTTRSALIVATSIKALRIPLGSTLRHQMRKVKAETWWRKDPDWWRYSLPAGRPVK